MEKITAKVHGELGGCMMQRKPEWELPNPERTEPQTTNRRRGPARPHTIAIISPKDGSGGGGGAGERGYFGPWLGLEVS